MMYCVLSCRASCFLPLTAYTSSALFSWKKIKPAVIVDKLIEAVVDVLVPGKGAGESNWFWRNLRSLERDSDRSECVSTWSLSQNIKHVRLCSTLHPIFPVLISIKRARYKTRTA